MHQLLFTNSAQRELVSICTQSIHDRNWLSLPYILANIEVEELNSLMETRELNSLMEAGELNSLMEAGELNRLTEARELNG